MSSPTAFDDTQFDLDLSDHLDQYPDPVVPSDHDRGAGDLAVDVVVGVVPVGDPWGVPAAECVMIGDTLGADILGAQLAGMRNVWVTNHAGHPANVAHRGNIVPEAEIPGLAELPALLARWQAAA